MAENSTYFNNPDGYDENNYYPILIVHTEAKGDFGSWFVETDENIISMIYSYSWIF